MNALRLILLAAGILWLVWLAWRGRRAASQVARHGIESPGAERSAPELARERDYPLPSIEVGARSAQMPLPVVQMPSDAADTSYAAGDFGADPERAAFAATAEAALDIDAVTDDELRATAVLPDTSPASGTAVELTHRALATTVVRADVPDFGGLSTTLAAGPLLRIEWPAEASRRIFALRVVPRIRDRLAGRELRLALEAQGLRHGPLGIYHFANSDGVSLLCAASLAKPGMLDPQQIDFQSFSGVNLFIVLPGPEDAGSMVDRLIQVARDLCQRVDGRLQDDSGAQLGAMRLAELREQLLSGESAGQD